MYFGSLAQTEAQADPVGRKFFESSVYRNVYDMVESLENRFGRFEKEVKGLIVQAWKNDPKGLTDFVLGSTNIRDKGHRPAGRYVARIYNKPWNSKFNCPWGGGDKDRSSNCLTPRDFYQSNPQTANFLANDLVREVINLERELNRIHIPMPGNFRAWADKVRDSANTISVLPKRVPIPWSASERMQAKREGRRSMVRKPKGYEWSWAGLGKEAGRLYASTRQMRNWLQQIKESIKKTELRTEQVKREQQEQAEKAYQKSLEKQRVEKVVTEQKEKEKQAAKEAKQQVDKVAAQTGMTQAQYQQAVQQAVTQAISQQRAQFQAMLERMRAEREAEKTEREAEKAKEKPTEQAGIDPAVIALAAAAAMLLMGGA